MLTSREVIDAGYAISSYDMDRGTITWTVAIGQHYGDGETVTTPFMPWLYRNIDGYRYNVGLIADVRKVQEAQRNVV